MYGQRVKFIVLTCSTTVLAIVSLDKAGSLEVVADDEQVYQMMNRFMIICNCI